MESCAQLKLCSSFVSGFVPHTFAQVPVLRLRLLFCRLQWLFHLYIARSSLPQSMSSVVQQSIVLTCVINGTKWLPLWCINFTLFEAVDKKLSVQVLFCRRKMHFRFHKSGYAPHFLELRLWAVITSCKLICWLFLQCPLEEHRSQPNILLCRCFLLISRWPNNKSVHSCWSGDSRMRCACWHWKTDLQTLFTQLCPTTMRTEDKKTTKRSPLRLSSACVESGLVRVLRRVWLREMCVCGRRWDLPAKPQLRPLQAPVMHAKPRSCIRRQTLWKHALPCALGYFSDSQFRSCARWISEEMLLSFFVVVVFVQFPRRVKNSWTSSLEAMVWHRLISNRAGESHSRRKGLQWTLWSDCPRINFLVTRMANYFSVTGSSWVQMWWLLSSKCLRQRPFDLTIDN